MKPTKADYKVIEWQEEMNGVSIDCSVDIAIHASNNDIILLTIPGVDGEVDGFEDKYIRIANAVQDKYGAAVVRMSNPFISSHHWESNIRQVIDYIQMNAKEICGNDKFELRIMAHSAGAAVIAHIANEYPEITRILLINPALKLKPDNIRDGLASINTRKVTVLFGSDDPSIGEASDIIGDIVNVIVVDGADHHFSGEVFPIFLHSPHNYLF